VKQIYVSPHADDVALSCGGQITSNPRRRDDVLVLNAFTSEQDESQEPRAGALALFDSVNPERTREDRAAWESIGVECVSANFPEALLRGRFPFRIVGGGGDEKVVESLLGFFVDQARSHPGATFHFPGGFGGHVDHLACTKAAFRLLDESHVDRIVLYEDAPYCWLRFIRNSHYRELLRHVALDGESRAQAFRPDGIGLLEYLGGKAVPFPRGKKLLPVVGASLRLRNGVRALDRAPKAFRAEVSTVRLDDDLLAQKTALVNHYKTQLPMLFGSQPDEVLSRFHESASREVTIEIRKRSSTVAQP
jgi:LmbE family N-acetylglucosaminyl deacetylase